MLLEEGQRNARIKGEEDQHRGHLYLNSRLGSQQQRK